MSTKPSILRAQRGVPSRSGFTRSGFTLTELLIAITVIAILAALAGPALFGALTTARQSAISVELMQIDAAVEDFKTHYGFYPPTIGANAAFEVSSAADMLPYLNRISRNHAEGNGTAGTRLATWWTEVGSKLDERSSLVFWLSGICKNKQFPLSGFSGATQSLAPWSTDQYFDGTAAGVEIERDVRYEFRLGQLVQAPTTTDNIRVYNQPHGSGDITYRYLDNKSYAAGGYAFGPGPPVAYVAPERFQLVAPGMDGVLATAAANPVIVSTADLGHDDNLVNFAEGLRFDKFRTDNE